MLPSTQKSVRGTYYRCIRLFKRIWMMLSGVLTAFKLISQNLTNQPQALHLTRSFPLASTLPHPFSYPVPHGYLCSYCSMENVSRPRCLLSRCTPAPRLRSSTHLTNHCGHSTLPPLKGCSFLKFYRNFSVYSVTWLLLNYSIAVFFVLCTYPQ